MGKAAFNFNEKRVLDVLTKEKKLTLAEIALKGFPGVRPAAKANSRVRNGLRTLVALGMAKLVDRGTYQLTGKSKPKVVDKRKKPAPAKKAPVVEAAATETASSAAGTA